MEKRLKELKWLKARCPICGIEYEYLPEYKPVICSSWACVHKFLHPELRKEVMSSEQGIRGTTTEEGGASTPDELSQGSKNI